MRVVNTSIICEPYQIPILEETLTHCGIFCNTHLTSLSSAAELCQQEIEHALEGIPSVKNLMISPLVVMMWAVLWYNMEKCYIQTRIRCWELYLPFNLSRSWLKLIKTNHKLLVSMFRLSNASMMPPQIELWIICLMSYNFTLLTYFGLPAWKWC